MQQRQEIDKTLSTSSTDLESTRAKAGDTLERRANLYLRIYNRAVKELLGSTAATDLKIMVTGMRFRGNQLIELAARANKKTAWIEVKKLDQEQFKRAIGNTLWSNCLELNADDVVCLKPNINMQTELNADVEKRRKNSVAIRPTIWAYFPTDLLSFETIQFSEKDPFPSEAIHSVRRSIAGKTIEQDGLKMRALGIGYRIRLPRELKDETLPESSIGVVSGIATRPNEILDSIGLRINCRDGVTRFYKLPFVTSNLEHVFSHILTKSMEENAFDYSAYIKIEDGNWVAEPGFVDALIKHAKERGERNTSTMPQEMFDWDNLSAPLDTDPFLMGMQERQRFNRADERKYKLRPPIEDTVGDEFKEEELNEFFLTRKFSYNIASNHSIRIQSLSFKPREDGGMILVSANYYAAGKQHRLSFLRPSQLPETLKKNEQAALEKWRSIKRSDDGRYFIIDSKEALQANIGDLFSSSKTPPTLPRFLLSAVNTQSPEAIVTTSSASTSSRITMPVANTIPIQVPPYFYLEPPRALRRDNGIRALSISTFNIKPLTNQLISMTLSYEQKPFMTVFFKKGVAEIKPPFDRLIEARDNNFYAKVDIEAAMQEISDLKTVQRFSSSLLNWDEGSYTYLASSEENTSKRVKFLKKIDKEDEDELDLTPKRTREEDEASDYSESIDAEKGSPPPRKRARNDDEESVQSMQVDKPRTLNLQAGFFANQLSGSKSAAPTVQSSATQGHDRVLYREALQYYLERCEQSSDNFNKPARRIAMGFLMDRKEQAMRVYSNEKPFTIINKLEVYFEAIKKRYPDDINSIKQALELPHDVNAEQESSICSL